MADSPRTPVDGILVGGVAKARASTGAGSFVVREEDRGLVKEKRERTEEVRGPSIVDWTSLLQVLRGLKWSAGCDQSRRRESGGRKLVIGSVDFLTCLPFALRREGVLGAQPGGTASVLAMKRTRDNQRELAIAIRLSVNG